MTRLAFLLLVASAASIATAADDRSRNSNAVIDLASTLEPLRVRFGLPALAAAVVVEGRVHAAGATGVRCQGKDARVTRDDRFHIGSCSKAITATLLARLVERGDLAWDTTVAEVFPEMTDDMHDAVRGVTMRQLVNHRAGLTAGWPPGMNFLTVHALSGSPREQRLVYTRRVLAAAPVHAPGSAYLYSNAGYAIAGAAAEAVADRPFEALVRDLVLDPLGITSAGFGAMATPGELEHPDQPWFHRLAIPQDTTTPVLVPMPVPPGPLADNPPAIAPAGTMHLTITDWAQFVADHVRAPDENDAARLRPATYRTLHTPPFGGSYAYGWIVTSRPWSRGPALTHAGSNNANFAVVWAAPERGFSVLVATNVAGTGIPAACDHVAAALIREHLRED